MMPEHLTQLGVGGLIAVLVIREVLGFLRSRKYSADLSPEYWQTEQRKALMEVTTTLIIPILANQTLILTELRNNTIELNRNMAIVLDRLMQQNR